MTQCCSTSLVISPSSLIGSEGDTKPSPRCSSDIFNCPHSGREKRKKKSSQTNLIFSRDCTLLDIPSHFLKWYKTDLWCKWDTKCWSKRYSKGTCTSLYSSQLASNPGKIQQVHPHLAYPGNLENVHSTCAFLHIRKNHGDENCMEQFLTDSWAFNQTWIGYNDSMKTLLKCAREKSGSWQQFWCVKHLRYKVTMFISYRPI